MDRLYLSVWLKSPSPLILHERFMTMARTFPFSVLRPNLIATVRAVSSIEAPLQEQAVESVEAMDTIREVLDAWRASDTCLELEGSWDLFQSNGLDWALRPARVHLFAYAPQFDPDEAPPIPGVRREDLRIDFGNELLFLPATEAPAHFRMTAQNIRSLLKLVSDLEAALPLERRLLWSESGGNFAERLADLASD
ncbi:MAG: hypothetical protein NTV70_13070 [Acidobacteria bacterium]|nr:hypothetical protein [Acidobacteriota bacterium]